MYEYRLVRANRKTMSLKIANDCVPMVRAPFLMPESKINAFVERNSVWIEKQLKKMTLQNCCEDMITENETALRKKAAEILPIKVKYFSCIMGLTPTAIKITSAKTRYGSCSARDSICFSYRLMAYPDEAIDYVVVHELAHIKYKNHSKRFYALISKYMPDYKTRRALLKKPIVGGNDDGQI